MKCSEVKVCKVPHLKTLNVADLIEFAKENTNIDKFLPYYNYQKQPSRKWLWNILNRVIRERFRDFIKQRQLERTDYILEKILKKLESFLSL